MSETTDAPQEGASVAPTGGSAAARKPRFALFIATACGLGYLPKAPGTWGSLGGAALSVALSWFAGRNSLGAINMERSLSFWTADIRPGGLAFLAAAFVAAVGVLASGLVSKRFGVKDPQFVVIDEVSGQQLTYLLAFVGGNWKYLLLGFILFRVFDIWKPFPARQAESLPGGWGIMADDWVAGIYAGIGLWIARAAGL
jgi:phosphatidylglycerophosphatase A